MVGVTAPRAPRPASRGFTLMELMVSVAILLALLAMVGTIFSTASKAGGQAQALSTVYRQLANAAESIRRDLANMDPTKDTLGIAGVLVNAPDSRKDPSIRGWHRADLLMLFTQRGDARPYVMNIGGADPNAYFQQRMQVVYGHADVGQYNSAANPPMTAIQYIEQAQMPAYNWHLSRRIVFVPNSVLTADVAGGVWDNSLDSTHRTTFVGLTSPYYLSGLADTFSNSSLDPVAWLTNPAGMGGYFEYSRNVNKELQYAYFPVAGGAYRYDPASGAAYRWLYYDGAGSEFWYAYNPSASPLPRWERTTGSGVFAGTVAPTSPASSVPSDLDTLFRDSSQYNYSLARLLFYNNDNAINRRTVIDPSPPAGYPGLLANQFLPNCTDFRVEYTYDDPRGVTLTRDDPLNTVSLPVWPILDPQAAQAFVRPITWRQVDSGQQIIWSRLSVLPSNDRTDPHRWPRAIRITLKSVDVGGRLADPVTYSIVHCWQ